MKPPTSWKNFELRIAKFFNSKRVGASGTETTDVYHDLYNIECKLGYGSGAKQRAWLKQADKQNGKLPIVIWKPKGIRDEDSIVLVRLKDFKDFYV